MVFNSKQGRKSCCKIYNKLFETFSALNWTKKRCVGTAGTQPRNSRNIMRGEIIDRRLVCRYFGKESGKYICTGSHILGSGRIRIRTGSITVGSSGSGILTGSRDFGSHQIRIFTESRCNLIQIKAELQPMRISKHGIIKDKTIL